MRALFLLALLGVSMAFFAAGCGGGGSSTAERAVSGTVTDIAGNLIPGAEIYLDGRMAATSQINGTYKINQVSSGPYNLSARAAIDGHIWYGSRAVNAYADGPTMNQNIFIAPILKLGEIRGNVTDVSNNPIANAQVALIARYPQDRPAWDASVVSKVTTTDRNGGYTLSDIPSGIRVNGSDVELIYDVIASSVGRSGQPRGFESVTKTAVVGDDAITYLNFTLQSSSSVSPEVPPEWTASGAIDAISYTIPAAIVSRSVDDAYDAVKSSISNRSGKVIALKRKNVSRAAPAGSIIENNVIWYYVWNDYFGIDVPSNLAGFSIYRRADAKPIQTGDYRIDFVRNPGIISYADASRELTAGNTYWYSVSAVSTSYLDARNQFNPAAESVLSAAASVKPLGRLSASSPANGESVNSLNPLFSWIGVPGARSYRVFVYDKYPIMDAMFTPEGDPLRPDHLPAWGESATVVGNSVVFADPWFLIEHGRTYWWVVMAGDRSDFEYASAYAISELRSFTTR